MRETKDDAMYEIYLVLKTQKMKDSQTFQISRCGLHHMGTDLPMTFRDTHLAYALSYNYREFKKNATYGQQLSYST